MTNKTPTLLVTVSLSCIAVLGGLVVWYSLDRQPNLTTTKAIDESLGTGGTQVEAPPDTERDSEKAAIKAIKAPKSAVNSPPLAPSAQPEPAVSAPRLAEIASSITIEYPYRALAITTNDPYSSQSLAFQRTGVSEAWNVTTGAPIVVAVIDTGYALQHEDLSTQWAINDDETGVTVPGDICWAGSSLSKSNNACDDDANGYIDDWRGWNFYGIFDEITGQWIQNNNPQAGILDANGAALSHGTQTAGLIGAASNNGKGAASANWQTKVMPLQALGDDGGGTTSDVVFAIYYAVDNGAQIINMSLGGDTNDPAVAAAIEYAYENDVIVIAAAGNCGTGQEHGCNPARPGAMSYPALNRHVIAVGATDQNNSRAAFSSYGPGLDVVAPGSGQLISPMIDQTSTPHNYTSAYAGSLYGTSFASPVVAGIASLIRSQRPTTDADDIIALINATSVKVPGMNGAIYSDQYGHGVVAADSSLLIAASLNTSSSEPRLLQTGNYKSEHTYSASSTMNSGCIAAASSYCTVHFTEQQHGYERYLPYAIGNISGQSGWAWPGTLLGSGEWAVSARQGALTSPSSYFLFAK